MQNYCVSRITSHMKSYAANLSQMHIVLDDKFDPSKFDIAFQQCLHIHYCEIGIRFGRVKGLN